MENIVEPGRPQMTMKNGRICISCWISKATYTPSECVILLLHGNNGCTNSPQCYFTVHCLCCGMYVPASVCRRMRALALSLTTFEVITDYDGTY